MRLLQPIVASPRTANLQDDKLEIYFGPQSIERDDDVICPFNISLNVHDKLLHYCFLDSRASHTLMPKSVNNG